MDEYEKSLKQMDFNFFADANHKISGDAFLTKDNAVFLDVRTNEEIESLKLKLSNYKCEVLHIPLHELPDRLNEIPRDKFVGLFCSGTQRASIAFGYLRGKGYDNVKIILATIDQMAGFIKPGKIKKMFSMN